MSLSIWDIGTLICKFLIYMGFAQAVAIPLMAYMCRLTQNMMRQLSTLSVISLSFALLASIGYFFIQVGIFSENGLMGVFDAFYIKLIWNSGEGEMTVLRVSAVILAFINLGIIKRLHVRSNQWIMGISTITYIINLLLIGLSVSASGHVSELSNLARFALGFHVLVAFAWLGSLWPLILVCQHFNRRTVGLVMHKFGQIASVFVALLVVAGVYLAFNLIADLNELTGTSYGQLLSLKLILVFLILTLAAYHKFILVPGILNAQKSSISLARSIKIELSIGMGILLMTALLTTLVGPASH